MKTESKTKQQLLLENEELRKRLEATERRLQEADEIVQAQIAERKRAEETVSPFPTLLPHSSNPPLLKHDPKLLLFFRLLAGHLPILFA